MNKNLLIVISGPSGVGKGTIVNELLKTGKYALSISCTTREIRETETPNVSYFFISQEEFSKLIEENGLLEYNNHFGNFYGTPRKFVEETLKEKNVILEIEVDGALKVKKSYPEAVLIMVLPPDEHELRERLKKRGTECEEKIEQRIKRMDYELSKIDEYDCTVVNDVLDDCVTQIENFLKECKND